MTKSEIRDLEKRLDSVVGKQPEDVELEDAIVYQLSDQEKSDGAKAIRKVIAHYGSGENADQQTSNTLLTYALNSPEFTPSEREVMVKIHRLGELEAKST